MKRSSKKPSEVTRCRVCLCGKGRAHRVRRDQEATRQRALKSPAIEKRYHFRVSVLPSNDDIDDRAAERLRLMTDFDLPSLPSHDSVNDEIFMVLLRVVGPLGSDDGHATAI